MDEWIPKLKICPLVGNLYPTPSQLVACWSIQSAVWALPYETNLVIIDNDGNENSIPVFEEYDEAVWRRLITNGMAEAEAESESESESETVTETGSETVTETGSETESETVAEEFRNDDEEEIATVTAVEALMEKEEEFTKINTVEYDVFVPVFDKNLNLNLP
jgi:hypothetical protein